jgi:acylglycerol lipase
MNHIEGNFKGVRTINCYYQGWLPEEDEDAVILIVHGLGEYSGRYMNVVNHLSPLGYALYGLDHIGHGKSDGQREFVERFDDFTDDLTIFYSMVKVWHPNKPIFLLGHSLGGLIAPYYLLNQQDNFKGAIFSAPLVKVPANISPITVLMGRLLSSIAPRTGVLPLNARGISKDQDVVNAYINDPLVFHGKTPARLAAEMLKAMHYVTANIDKITLPFITLQGSADQLVDVGGAQLLYDKASSVDKTIKIYDGLYHEIFNEPERAIVLKDLDTWLNHHK